LIILVSGLAGALLTIITTAVFHFWKLHRDEMKERCDELCTAIVDCSSAAAEYWATQYNDLNAMRIAEAKILGLQSLFDGLYAELRPRLNVEQAEEIDSLLSSLLDNISGGQFSVKNRTTDAGRTGAVLQVASAAVVAIRRAYHLTMPFVKLAQTFRENRNRRLDMPSGWER
jgi:hypothetical protein